MVLLQQEEEGGQVRQNIRQPKNHIKECEFEHLEHPGKRVIRIQVEERVENPLRRESFLKAI